MNPQAQDAPRDLHELQYAAWICENRLGVPAVKSNLEVIAQAIAAISKAKFRDKPRPIFTSFLWLERQCEFAQAGGTKINHLFFLNGDYNEVNPPEKKLEEFVPCDKCSCGFVTVLKDGQKIGVTQCDCRKQWIERVKKS